MHKIKFFVLLLFISSLLPLTAKQKAKIILENGVSFTSEVAVSKKEKRMGLSFRKKQKDIALLFWYDKPQELLFWMKDMYFSLDILWIRDNKVVHIEKNVPPPNILQKKLPVYGKNILADKVLEVPAGESQNYGMELGTKMRFVLLEK